MTILAVETSCDESAVAILSCAGDDSAATFTVLGNGLLSQIDIHQPYGGVYPALAKREHAKNLVPLLHGALEEAELLSEGETVLPEGTDLGALLARETELLEALKEFLSTTERPSIDAIAVTYGPGLEPALWVGVNFAKALSLAWGVPIVAVSHMEGHALSGLLSNAGNNVYQIQNTELPVLSLLISGGHTELLLSREWLSYELMGATRDDAVGEAFDKVARMLALPYPGGPEISRLAERDREDERTNPFTLPRPMFESPDFDFSFSGLKTAVMYLLKKHGELSTIEREQLARAFEDAVAEVLAHKTSRALTESGAKTLSIGGGVSANTHIRRKLEAVLGQDNPDVVLNFPPRELTGDNAIMIGIAGFYRALRREYADESLKADGNLSLA